jgi:hypothetical protein
MDRWLRGPHAWTAWDVLLVLAFLPGAAFWAVIVIAHPEGLGSHASIYTGAAAAWLNGGDPWSFGPPAALFAGPPSMLMVYLPFLPLPVDLTRVAWFALDLATAAWVLRRLEMRAYWLAFPPLFAAIVLGHVEVLVLAFIALRGPLAGLAAVVKPYAALPLLAERRWNDLALAATVLVVTLPVLPWARFIAQAGSIADTLARQNVGDAVFGDPVLMVVGLVALAGLGLRRALWLAVPVLWPYAQPIYKTMTLPVLSPVLAIAWALPVPGATLGGVVALAALVTVDRIRPLPAWLKAGIEPAAKPFARPQPGLAARLPEPMAA